MRILYIFVFMCLSIGQNAAQSFLQLEKRGTLKTERYYVGEVLYFQMEGDENWYGEEIIDIMLDDKLVLFENRVVSINNISKIRNSEKGQFWRGLGNKLMIFGASFLGISLVGTLADWELQNDTWIITGTALATGGIIRLLSNSRTYKLGKRRWLRPLNTDFNQKKA